MSVSGDNTVLVWNASIGEIEHVLKGHSNAAASVALSSAARYIGSGSWDKLVQVWSAETA